MNCYALRSLFFYLCLGLILSSCEDDISAGNNPSSITINDRERLGDIIRNALLRPNSCYSYYDEASFPDLYSHLNELYEQMYFVKRDVGDWNTSRKWKVLVLRTDEQIATTLPGGHFVISKGFMQLFKYEYELLYVMSFECVLMSERYLLEQMAQDVDNIADLRELAETGNPITALDIACEIFENLSFSTDIVREADAKCIQNICENSLYKVDGLRAFWDKLNVDQHWLRTRTSDINRDDFIRDLMLEHSCEDPNRLKFTNKGESYYEDVILNFLN